jgi:hypothetical protein
MTGTIIQSKLQFRYELEDGCNDTTIHRRWHAPLNPPLDIVHLRVTLKVEPIVLRPWRRCSNSFRLIKTPRSCRARETFYRRKSLILMSTWTALTMLQEAVKVGHRSVPRADNRAPIFNWLAFSVRVSHFFGVGVCGRR